MIDDAWMWPALARGMALGVAVAAPIGPTAALCIERTMVGGLLSGMATGYGAATTHLAYASAAATGLTALLQVLSATSQFALLLKLGCAAFLIYLAVRTARRPVATLARASGRIGGGRLRLAGSYAIGLGWTLGNPVTLLSFLALEPGFAGHSLTELGALSGFVLGVFLGSACWWTALTGCVAAAHGRLSGRTLRAANLVTAGLLALGAVGMLTRSVGGP
ncbi:MAG: LysE family transporter [Rhodospirillales bacterium]|nr:LysE family transporter [Rhodospirillales bacterium]